MVAAETPALPPAESAAPARGAPQYIRGSSLLVAGRVIAQTLEFAAQVMLVRYLGKGDYGAFVWALSLVLLLRGVAIFELPDTLARFIPLYRERGRDDLALGGVLLGLAIVAGLGALIAVVVDASLVVFHLQPTSDPRAVDLLAILVVLVPLEALDVLLTALFAVFAGPRAIFFRQCILGPGLKLAVVVAVVLGQSGVREVAFGYIAAGAVGLAVYAVLFARLLRAHGLRQTGAAPKADWPVREILTFAVPLLTSALVWLVMDSSDALLLGALKSTEEVAKFRAVLPMALLNQGVIVTFTLLYTPLAARLYARGEHDGVARLYWQSALWVTVLTYPIFLLTFAYAPTTTVTLYGQAYAGSAVIMTMLAAGYFFHTSLGFNGLTVKVYGKLRYSVAIDVTAALLNVAINLALIPPYGAVGAAAGTLGALIVHNVLKQVGLWRFTGIPLLSLAHARTLVAVYGGGLALLAAQRLVPIALYLALPVAAVAGIAVAVASRRRLEIGVMFPEVARMPLLRWLGESR